MKSIPLTTLRLAGPLCGSILSLASNACQPYAPSSLLPPTASTEKILPTTEDNYEMRSYGNQKLSCTPHTAHSRCIFSKAQELNGIFFPKGSIAYQAKENSHLDWVLLPWGMSQMLFIGDPLAFNGVRLPSVRSVSFHRNGEISEIDAFGFGPQLQNGWDACCIYGTGCILLFDTSGNFQQCKNYELGGSD